MPNAPIRSRSTSGCRPQVRQRATGQRRPDVPRRRADARFRRHGQGRVAVLRVVVALLERLGENGVTLAAGPPAMVIAGEAGVASGGPCCEPLAIDGLPAAMQVHYRGNPGRSMRRGVNAIDANRLAFDVGREVDFLVVGALVAPTSQDLLVQGSRVRIVSAPDLRRRQQPRFLGQRRSWESHRQQGRKSRLTNAAPPDE